MISPRIGLAIGSSNLQRHCVRALAVLDLAQHGASDLDEISQGKCRLCLIPCMIICFRI